ncbi:MAG: branched-chain amino acid ABC transporter permease, partial [Deltaproteobacteria bacterium]|nr:branched-chain amino acid ABC transporter permease [Deltaproteobacteria bacterium]
MEEITFASQLLQYTITGITVGSIYAMVAIGFNVIYNVTEAINFAQGEFVMLGGLIMVFLQVVLHIPL